MMVNDGDISHGANFKRQLGRGGRSVASFVSRRDQPSPVNAGFIVPIALAFKIICHLLVRS